MAMLAALALSLPAAAFEDSAKPQSTGVPLDHLPALKGSYFQLASEATARNYHIYVRLPEGYDPKASRRYPVVYVLDGDSLFPLLAPTHLFLTYDEQLPEAVIVGISYGGFERSINKRHIDFSAPAQDAAPGEDGAPRFLSFLRNELLPAVESRYSTDPSRRVLLGQSRGGYFVLWSALEAPDLFWGRIASNPSFAPGRARFFADASPHTRRDLKVVLASGSRETELRRRNAAEWAQAWQERTGAPWQVKLLVIQGGTHAASVGDAYRQAMLWLFSQEVAPR
jgi:predicted alpha/beta superfamily hydrolase